MSGAKTTVLCVAFLFSLISIAPASAQNISAEPAKSNIDSNCDRGGCSGDSYWQSGNIYRAIAQWQQEALNYHHQNRKSGEIKTRLKIAQGYNSLGQYNLAVIELGKVREIQSLVSSNPQTKAIVQEMLGNAYSGLGNDQKAILSYQNSLKQETSLSTLNNLAKLLDRQSQSLLSIASSAREDEDAIEYKNLAERKHNLALKYARQALISSQSENSTSSVRALIEWNNLSQTLNPQQLELGSTVLSKLQASTEVGYLMLDWAKIDRNNQTTWLKKALDLAQSSGNAHLESYALLELGYIFEELQDLNRALSYAQKAQIKAQSIFDYYSLFNAQQLAGRIYQKTERKKLAIDTYFDAIASIDIVTQNIGSTNKRQIINLSEEIQPIYRETLNLLLSNPQVTSSNLSKALLIFDKLRLAQLSSYFGDNCFKLYQSESFQEDSTPNKGAATINSIILEDKTYFILQLPDGKLVKSEADITKTELVNLADRWSEELYISWSDEYRTTAVIFYNLIIKPFEAQLKAKDLEILVFVHDGVLRNLPMAALLDKRQGGKFLAQKWASVSSIGLDFTPMSSKPTKTEVAAFGLSIEIPGWDPLYNVPSEIVGLFHYGGKPCKLK